jgi:hypothetical protein
VSAQLFSAGVGRRSLSNLWRECADGDEGARAIFHRHYSYRPYADGRAPKLFVGPGAKLVLITESADALFVWRKFISGDGQRGVNCAVFRNESPTLASLLILEAEEAARDRWGDERFFTYVNPRKIQRTRTPGRCFIKAGWKATGITKWNRLIILAKEPINAAHFIQSASESLT